MRWRQAKASRMMSCDGIDSSPAVTEVSGGGMIQLRKSSQTPRQPSPSARVARGFGWQAAYATVVEGCPP